MQIDNFMPEGTGESTPEPRSGPRVPKGIVIAVFIAVLLLAAFLVLHFGFTVRYEQIDLTIEYDASNPVLEAMASSKEVLELAGITGDFISFTKDPETIRSAINEDYHYSCSEVELTGNRLRLVVRQRQKRAYVDAGGVLFTVDEDGMILERCGTQRADGRLILIEGMMPSNPQVGELLTPNKAAQLTAYQEVLFQLKDLSILTWFDTLNVRDPDDIYMNTKDGYTVHLGDRVELRKKIKTVRIVLQTLASCVDAAKANNNQEDIRKYSAGILEVLQPGKIVYSPIN